MSNDQDELSDLMQFLYVCPVGLVEIGNDGGIGMMNPTALQLLLPVAKGGDVSNFFRIMASYAPELRNMVAAFDDPQGTICSNHRVFVAASLGPGLSEAKVFNCTLVRLDANRIMASLNDVSKEVAQERRLKQAETWFASLLNGINDFAVLSLDQHGRIDGTNPSVMRQTGFSDDDLLGQPLDTLVDPDATERGEATGNRIEIVHGDGWHLDEGWHRRKKGERYWCQSLVAARSEEKDDKRVVSGYTVVIRDVTQQEHDTRKLRRMLTTDTLTGARNRAHFFEAAEQEKIRLDRRGGHLSLVALDVDHFKKFNDQHGHAVGDAVLKAIAGACMGEIRPQDTFARIGGEEFVILVPGLAFDATAALAERLRAAVSRTIVTAQGKELQVTASFGCATMGGTITTIAGLLEAADAGLYQAKRNGRDCVAASLPGSQQAAA